MSLEGLGSGLKKKKRKEQRSIIVVLEQFEKVSQPPPPPAWSGHGGWCSLDFPHMSPVTLI